MAEENIETINLDFDNKMRRIISKLGIVDTVRDRIIEDLATYAVKDKTKIINNIDIRLPELLKADEQLNNLFDNGALKPYKDSIQIQWTDMTKQLAELQGLSILKKVHQNDCDGVIRQLLLAITGKLTVVNQIMKEGLNQTGGKLDQAGGNNDLMYKPKYLKYKTKYLNLMKNNKL